MRLAGLFVAILVLVAIVVLPVHPALAQRPPPDPTRSLPAKVERGETFYVTVNFTACADNFNGISLRDTAPDGWVVEANDGMWCVPEATGGTVWPGEGGNQVRFGWIGPYGEGDNFTAKYRVTVPCNASLANHSFSVDYPSDNMLRWKTGDLTTVKLTNIAGDYVLEVTRPTINFTPTSIDFYGAVNGTNPQDRTLELWSSTSCMLNWNLTDDANYTGANHTNYDWLSESPENGSCTDVHSSATLSVNTSDMHEEGEYFANITINAPEANNSVGIVPVTLHMSKTDVLEAHVSFAGRGTNNTRWIEAFEVLLFSPGATTPWWHGNRTTSNTGWFNLSDVPVGTYDIAIKNATCLSELEPVTVSEGVGGVVDFGETREGDVEETDKVDFSDFILLSGAYSARDGDPNWNPNADLNRSGKVDFDDFILLSGNYNERGAAYGHF